jgi:hypothetical protein
MIAEKFLCSLGDALIGVSTENVFAVTKKHCNNVLGYMPTVMITERLSKFPPADVLLILFDETGDKILLRYGNSSITLEVEH